MALSAAPQQLTGKSLLGKVALALRARAGRGGKPSRAAAFITDHTGTLTALGFMVTAMWHEGDFWGWLGTGVAVLVAELKIRG